MLYVSVAELISSRPRNRNGAIFLKRNMFILNREDVCGATFFKPPTFSRVLLWYRGWVSTHSGCLAYGWLRKSKIEDRYRKSPLFKCQASSDSKRERKESLTIEELGPTTLRRAPISDTSCNPLLLKTHGPFNVQLEYSWPFVHNGVSLVNCDSKPLYKVC